MIGVGDAKEPAAPGDLSGVQAAATDTAYSIGQLKVLARRLFTKVSLAESLQSLHFHAEQRHRDLLEAANASVQRTVSRETTCFTVVFVFVLVVLGTVLTF